MQSVDLIVSPEWLLPMNAPRLQHHSLVVHQGNIIDIVATQQVCQRYHATQLFELPHQVVMPGFVNAHTHAAMSLFRGYADDKPLMDWLQNYIWPAESQWVDEAFVETGVQLAIAEMIRSGTTCFHDMYFFPNSAAKVVEATGIRASLGMVVLDFPTPWATSPEQYIEKGLALLQQNQCPNIRFSFDPHAPYTVSDTPLQNILALSEQHQVPIQMHVHETAFEVTQAETDHGQRPLARLQQLGLLSPRFQAVHMTQLTLDEIALLAQTGCHVVHCPESNLKLASGFCPVSDLMAAGVNVALGTDGSASNNDLDMLSEMRTAALLAKGVSGNAASLNAAEALQMATLNGAKALGFEDVCGSLEIGKAADFIAIDLDALETMPCYQPESQIVYSASRNQIRHVWVNGVCLMKDRQLTTINEIELRENVKRWQHKIGSRHAQ